ncbi:hypothetical protein MMC20_005258 [Loxospora ochrophaea]|nr:hypothetical protein [Loxospora ochrophaea]
MADLESSSTPQPFQYPCKDAGEHLDDVASKFARSFRERSLSETPICYEDSYGHMEFLGEHKTIPFFMVKVRPDLSRFAIDVQHRKTPTTIDIPEGSQSRGSSPWLAESDSILGNPISASADDTDTEDEVDLVTTRNGSEGREIQTTSLFPAHGIEAGAQSSSLPMKPRSKVPPVPAESFTKGTPRLLASKQVPSTSRSSVQNPDHFLQQSFRPQALCLTISLSKCSFLPSFDKESKKHTILDVKIDVFFNGELCASTYIPERYRLHDEEIVHQFTGRRIARLVEKPWSIFPPDRAVDGTLTENKKGNEVGEGAGQRWRALSKIFLEEAEKGGRNKYGELSVLGSYLGSLAGLRMPRELENMQRVGGLKYGVLDVVMTAGIGQKDPPSTPYIDEPTRMRLRGFQPTLEEDNVKRNLAENPSMISNTIALAPKPRPRTFADSQIVSQQISQLQPRSASRRNPATANEDSSRSRKDAAVEAARESPFVTPRAPSAAPSAILRRRTRASHHTLSQDNVDNGPKRKISPTRNMVDQLSNIHLSNPMQLEPQRASYDASGLRRNTTSTEQVKSPLAAGVLGPIPEQSSLHNLESEDLREDVNTSKATQLQDRSASQSISLARASSLPANQDSVQMLERMRASDPKNRRLHIQAGGVARSTYENIPLQTRRASQASSTESPSSDTLTGRQRLSLNAQARPRSTKGFFLKSPTKLENALPQTFQSLPQKRNHDSGLGSETHAQPKRSRMNYHIVLDSKMTLAEEMESIEAASKESSLREDPESTNRSGARRSFGRAISATSASINSLSTSTAKTLATSTTSLASAPGNNPSGLLSSSSAPTIEASGLEIKARRQYPSKIIKLKLKGPRNPPANPAAAFTLVPSHLPPRAPAHHPEHQPSLKLAPISPTPNLPHHSHPNPTPPPPSIPPKPRPISRSARRRPPRPRHPTSISTSKSNSDSNTGITAPTNPTVIPPPPAPAHPSTTSNLSDDCIITYAEGTVRQVRSQRSGWFAEREILMGVRFLVEA